MFNKNSVSFDFVRYANVWEDADILCEALRAKIQSPRILSIASSGDNVLALLTLDPKEIVAVDMSAPQLACLELRLASFKELDYPTLCSFLGVTPSNNRLEIYDGRLKTMLSTQAQAFFEPRREMIAGGIIQGGKFETYLKLFGTKILPWIHSKKKVERLLSVLGEEERKVFYEEEWDTWKWRLLFRIFFSRFVMGRKGRDPRFFDNVKGKTADRILERSKGALTHIDAHKNPYLRYILTGNFHPSYLPLYLREEFFEVIKARASRVKLVCGAIEEALEGKFDAFNLSDIFEYMDENQFSKSYGKLVEHANKGARLAYWNMLVDRSSPHGDRIVPLESLSGELHAKDKAWFYKRFVVEEVT